MLLPGVSRCFLILVCVCVSVCLCVLNELLVLQRISVIYLFNEFLFNELMIIE